MTLTPISAASPAASSSLAWSADGSGIRHVPQVPKAKVWTPPLPIIGGNVMVEFDRHAASGAQVVKFIDKRSGETINQLPAQQVLDTVSALMELFRKRETAR